MKFLTLFRWNCRLRSELTGVLQVKPRIVCNQTYLTYFTPLKVLAAVMVAHFVFLLWETRKNNPLVPGGCFSPDGKESTPLVHRVEEVFHRIILVSTLHSVRFQLFLRHFFVVSAEWVVRPLALVQSQQAFSLFLVPLLIFERLHKIRKEQRLDARLGYNELRKITWENVWWYPPWKRNWLNKWAPSHKSMRKSHKSMRKSAIQSSFRTGG